MSRPVSSASSTLSYNPITDELTSRPTSSVLPVTPMKPRSRHGFDDSAEMSTRRSVADVLTVHADDDVAPFTPVKPYGAFDFTSPGT